MKILVVEDNIDRIRKFQKELVGHNVFYADTAIWAKKLLIDANHLFNLIFLDHDLGGETYVDSDNENTGYQVAKIIKGSQSEKAKVIVHSCNPVGAQNIKNILSKAKLEPFVTLNILDEIEEINVN